MIKNILKCSIFTLILTVLVGCTNQELSEKYDATRINTVSESIIQDFNAERFDDIIEKSSDLLKSQLTADQLKQAWTGIGAQAGAFVEILPNIKYVEKSEYVTAIVSVAYENKKIQYTLSYDPDMKLVGVYLK